MNFSFKGHKTVGRWRILILFVLVLIFNTACVSEFDKYYYEQKEKGLSLSINQILHGDTDFSEFAALVDKSGIDKLLKSGAVYTMFAPTNEAIEAYNNENPEHTTTDMDSVSLKNFVNYHIVFGIFYKYDFDKRYRKGRGNRYPTRMYDIKGFQYKYVSVYPPSFFGKFGFKNYSSDYQKLYQTSYDMSDSTFNVEGVSVIREKMDMGCTNGVVHGINKVMEPRKNLLDELKSDPRFSLYYSFLMRFDTLMYDAVHSTVVNGVEKKAYKTEFWYKNNGVLTDLDFDFLDETVDLTLFPASNDVINAFFGPYLSNFQGSYDKIPDDIVVDLLKHNLLQPTKYPARLYLQDMEGGIRMTDSRNVLQPTKILEDSPIVTSNGLIYPTTKLLTPPRLSSITGRILLDPQFASMKYLLDKTNYMNTISNSDYASNEFLLGERIRYPKSWTIIAPSDVAFNDSLKGGLESFSDNTLKDYAKFLIIPDTVYLSDTDDAFFDKGVFIKSFSDGYYKTMGGTFMRKLGNTLYSSFFADSVANIIDVVKGSNGVIYVVDDILYPVPYNVTIFSQMVNFMSTASQVIQEITNGQHSGLVTEMRSSSSNLTFFIPTNEAIESYNVLAQSNGQMKTWGVMTAEEKERVIRNHMVRKRLMVESQRSYSVYSTVGNKLEIYKNTNGQLCIKGENTHVPEAKFISANLQGSNGVVHFIDQLIIPE